MPLISHIEKAGFLIIPLKIKSSYLAQRKALISCTTSMQSSDLHLCFHICKSRFSHEAAHLKSVYLAHTKVWFCSLFAYAKSLFSHDTASIKSVNLAQTNCADQLRIYHVSATLFIFVQKHVFSSFGSYKVFLLSTKVLISCSITMQLICTFVLA